MSRLYGAQFARAAGLAATSIVLSPVELRLPSLEEKPRNHRHYRPASSGFGRSTPICLLSVFEQLVKVEEEGWRFPSWFWWFLGVVLPFYAFLFLLFSRRSGRRTKELVEKSEKLAEEIERREALKKSFASASTSRSSLPGFLIFHCFFLWRSSEIFLRGGKTFFPGRWSGFFGEEEGYLGRGEHRKVEIEEGMVLWRERLCLEGPVWTEGESLPERCWRKKEPEKLVFSSFLSRSKTVSGVLGITLERKRKHR